MVADPGTDVEVAVRSGDESAFARLVRAWSPGLMRTAMALTGDPASAEKVVRATWARVPAELPDYRPPPAFWGWVCGLLLGQLGLSATSATQGSAGASAAGPAPPTVDPSRFLPPTHPEWPGHWAIPPTSWPAMQDARTERGVGSALRTALDRLPTAQRVVVGLRDVAGCEVGEIATIVEQPPEQVRDQLHRGRAELRRHLELHFSRLQPA